MTDRLTPDPIQGEPEPLSDEELRYLRNYRPLDLVRCHDLIDKLLANLDAARAALPVEPDVETLDGHGPTDDDPLDIGVICAKCREDWPCEFIEGARAAIRAIPEPQDAEAYVRGHWDGLNCEANGFGGRLSECEHVGRIYEPKLSLAAIPIPSERPHEPSGIGVSNEHAGQRHCLTCFQPWPCPSVTP